MDVEHPRRTAGGLLLLTVMLLASCATLKRGYEAACLEACRADGGAAQGTSRCERGCRTR